MIPGRAAGDGYNKGRHSDMDRVERMARKPGRLLHMGVLCGLLATGGATAATFEDLYTVMVPIETNAQSARAQIERDAMAKLLTRVTGRRDAGDAPELAHLVSGAGRFVDVYGGSRRADEATVGFFRSAIESELESLGWPVWGAERPLTLIWLAVDRGSGERGVLASTGSDDAYTPEMADLLERFEEELREAADARGLPITLPLWDLIDINAISFAELWGGFDLQIAQASRRYGADAVLVGRVQQTQFGTRVNWTLVRDRERRPFVSGNVASGIHWLADQFASIYASVGGARSTRITVSGVGSLADYGRVMRFLDSVDALESVDVETLEDSVLTLRVAARGDASVLERVLTLGEVLAPVQRRFGDEIGTGALAFSVVR